MNDQILMGTDGAVARERSLIGVFGWVMGLVSIAIAFLALGAYLGRDLSRGAALTCFFIGFGMLLASSFGGERFRRGSFAMGWLFGTAALIGLSLGPTLKIFLTVDPDSLVQAIAGTAATVLAMASIGLVLNKDLAPWMRPLSLVVFALCGVTIVWSLVAGALNPLVSVAIYLVSALLLVVDFNYLRKHGTEDDAIWLATGIFVSIVNIFTSLLHLFGGD